MRENAFGPRIDIGQWPAIGGVPGGPYTGEYNADAGPNAAYCLVGRLDPRFQVNKDAAAGSLGALIFDPDDRILDQVPSTAATNNIAAAQAPTNGTPLTLVGSSGAGITVLAAAYQNPLGNTFPVGALVVDGLPGLVTFGQNKYVQAWDPTKLIARAVSITGLSSGVGGTVTVKGLDLYGNLQTDTVTLAAGANTVNTLKAFKAITAVTPNFTDTINVAVGTADVFGFPGRADIFADVLVYWNNALITANTGFVAADTTSPATALTGDVRGSYAVQSASDGTKRLQVFWKPRIANIASVIGLFGVTPA